MKLIVEKSHRAPVIKSCLECGKSVNTEVHSSCSFKGHLLHTRCADSLFGTLFLTSHLADKKTFGAAKRKTKGVAKIDKCLICLQHASGSTGFKHRIVYNGDEVQLKMHRECFFNRFGIDYDQETKRPSVEAQAE